MLNRRFLRVKALQAFYAYEQAKYANYQLAKDLIHQAYIPDWDEKKDADLERQRQDSYRLFDLHYEDPSSLSEVATEIKIKKVTVDAMNFYHNQTNKDQRTITHNLVNQVDKMYDTYLSILALLIELAKLASIERENIKNRYLPNNQLNSGDLKFAENPICQLLREHEVLQNEITKRGISWEEQADLVRDLYRNFIKTDEVYQHYARKSEVNFEDEKEIILHILRDIIFNQKTINYFSLSEIFLDESSFMSLARLNSFGEVQMIVKNAIEGTISAFFAELKINSSEKVNLISTIHDKINAIAEEIKRNAQAPLEKPINAKTRRNEDSFEKKTEEPRFQIERLLQQSIRVLIEQFSACLSQQRLNAASQQNVNLEAINNALAKFFSLAQIQWSNQNKFTVQIEVEQVSFGINEYFAQDDLNWTEDNKIIQSMAQKTIKNIETPQSTDFELVALSANWEDDKQFFQDLLKKTIENDKEYEGYIIDKAQNWDLTRLALIDKAILKMAICEMIYFYSIPVKVTINEYIELAKMYSTPKSKQFVNGLLDAISQELTEKKIIKKSGRGLMDNR